MYVQYRHAIPTPVDRTSVGAWLCKHPWITCQKRAMHINDPRSLLIKATFSYEVINASIPRELDGNLACSRALC